MSISAIYTDFFTPSISLGNNYCLYCGQSLGMQVTPIGNNTYKLSISSLPTKTSSPTIPLSSSKIPIQSVATVSSSRKVKRNYFVTKYKAVILGSWIIVGILLLLISNQTERKIINPPPTPSISPTPDKSALPSEVSPDGVYRSSVEIKGESGEFVIYLLDKDYVWVTGSIMEVERLGKLVEKNGNSNEIKVVTPIPFSSNLQNDIRNSSEVIVIGTADVRNNTEREELRANDRTQTLRQVVKEIKGNSYSVFGWSLGKWKSSENVNLSDQRRIILIRVISRTEGLDLTEGVRQALEKHKTTQPIFNQILNDYSGSITAKVK